MKLFENCYDIYEVRYKYVMSDYPFHPIKRRITERTNVSITMEAFINSLRNLNGYILIDNSFKNIQDFTIFVKRLNKVCPKLFSNTLSCKELINLCQNKTYPQTLYVNNGTIDREIPYIQEVIDIGINKTFPIFYIQEKTIF